MKRHMIHVAIIYLMLLLLPSSRSAELELPETIDLGRVRVGERKEFNFPVRNISLNAVKVTSIDPLCSCTNVELEGSSILEPGAQGTIKGIVHFSRNLGFYQTAVTINTQSGGSEKVDSLTVRLGGLVVSTIVLSDSVVDLGKIDQSTSSSVIVEARNGNAGEAWDGVYVNDDSKGLQVDTEKVHGGTAKVIVRVFPERLPIGIYHHTLNIYPTRDGRKLLYPTVLALSARIEGPMHANPTSVYIGVAAPSAIIKKSIVVSSTTLDLTNLKVTSIPSAASLQAIRLEKHSAEFLLYFVVPADLGLITKKIEMTEERSGTSIVIPIVGTANREQVD